MFFNVFLDLQFDSRLVVRVFGHVFQGKIQYDSIYFQIQLDSESLRKKIMLRYFVWVVRDLAVPGIVFAVILAFTALFNVRHQKKAVLSGSIAGLAGAVSIAVIRHFYLVRDRKILIFNLYVGGIMLFAGLIYLIFSFGILSKKNSKLASIILNITGAVFSACLLTYYLPTDLLYPFHFLIKGQSVFSTDFLFKLIGFCFGAVLVFLVVLCIYKILVNLPSVFVRIYACIVYAMNFLVVFPFIISQMLIRRWIKLPREIRNLNRFFLNHESELFFILIAVAFALALVLFYRSLNNNEPYSNPAEHRKIRAKCRNQRRWIFAFVVFGAISVVNLSVLQSISKRTVQLSEAEPFDMTDGKITIPLEKVSDKTLHRFEYKTEDDIGIRFIIIQKNAFSFGVGFDACEICGATGYYQKKDQVICKLCDVVMNINTIGFKGGCNPIPLPYLISDGQIIIDVRDLEVEKRRFR